MYDNTKDRVRIEVHNCKVLRLYGIWENITTRQTVIS